MMFLLTLIATALASNNLERLSPSAAWEQWQTIYSSHEMYGDKLFDEDRQAVFFQHHAIVKAHNELYRAGNYTSFLELNQFAALSAAEFNFFKGYNPKKMDLVTVSPKDYKNTGKQNPASVDWRDQGYVNPVKNQGQCGSCWAFSTIVSAEGQLKKVSGNLVSLSEQDLVDCVKHVSLNNTECCMGCNGGLMPYAFQYMIDSQNGGGNTEASYSYTGKDGTCKYRTKDKWSGAKVDSFTQVYGEDDLADAVANVGPISVAVDANIAWQLYGGGVTNAVGCSNSPNKLDHGVAVVGYGTDGSDYWIVRNSWGATWGEKGYMRLKRGSNRCGIADAPCYPNMSKA